MEDRRNGADSLIDRVPGIRAVLCLFEGVCAAPDWVQLAGGFGVPGVRVDDAEGLCKELERALAESGPHLVEVRL